MARLGMIATFAFAVWFFLFRQDEVPTGPDQIAAITAGQLISAQGQPLSSQDPEDSTIKYYAIYYSAGWCPPCHLFTPTLVQFYNAFKPSHPNFELIFVSRDRDHESMLNYMREMAMPWPALRFSSLMQSGSHNGLERYAGDAIPDLVLVNCEGKVLSDTFRFGEYTGPDHVIEDIKRLVP